MSATIRSKSAYAFDAPYSPALRSGDLLIISGQVSVGPDGSLIGEGSSERQARQIFANIGALLTEAGLSFGSLILVRYYLTNIDDWPAVSRVRSEFLQPPYPAGSAVEVGRLVRPEWLLEVEAVATFRE